MEARLNSFLFWGCAALGCGSSPVDDPILREAGNDSAAQAGEVGSSAGRSGAGAGGRSVAGRTGSLAGRAGSSSGAGGLAGACNPNEPLVCVDTEQIRGCTEEGDHATAGCVEVCETALRLTPGGCTTAEDGSDGCDCGAPLNPSCYAGASAICVCFDDCTADDFFTLYLGCDAQQAPIEEATLCYEGLLIDGTMGLEIDCAAAEQCLAPTP